MSDNEQNLSLIEKMLEPILATTARLLLKRDMISSASVVVHGRASIHPETNTYYNDGDLWNVWFHLPVDVYETLEAIDSIAQEIDRTMREVVSSVTPNDFVNVAIKIDCEAGYDARWRDEIAKMLSGELVSNQGRVRSDNIAKIQYEGLLFRSEPEVFFYRAAKRRGLPIAPLPVFVQGGNDYHRTEPDFVIIKDGVTVIVELDGNQFHRETPVQAQNRLRFLTQQGASLYRVESSRCATLQGADECLAEVIDHIRSCIRTLR